MALHTPRNVETARVVSLGSESRFLEELKLSLKQKSFEVQQIDLDGSRLASWLKEDQRAAVFGFDFQQYLSVADKDTKKAFAGFVWNKTFENSLCVAEESGLDLLNSQRFGLNDEHVKKEINFITAQLAFRSQNLEDITQHWADSHLRNRDVRFPEEFLLRGALASVLRYGENPHQIAALYRTVAERIGVASSRQVQGKQLSFNNINDTDAAFECVSEFDPVHSAACVIVKHANPCGVAEGKDLVSAYRAALACDTTSAFGGIVALNRILDAEAASAITEIFTEVIIAPDATPDAIRIVRGKKNLRLLLTGGLADPRAPGVVAKTVAGGILIQTRDNAVVDDMKLTVKTKRQPTSNEWRDLKFAFRVAKHVKSNTIVYAKDLATVGIGAGQMSRIDSARIAARKARDAADELKLAQPMTKGSVVASDAFFPFRDGLLVAIEAGATAVIQPGGSVRDDEVIKAADDHGIAMVFTDVRHFRH